MKCFQIALLLSLGFLGAGAATAGVLSPYDRYYIDAAANEETHPNLPVGAIFDGCIQGCLSQLMGSGVKVAGYAWQCCKEATALVCTQEAIRAEAAPARYDKSDRRAERGRAATARGREPTEWLYVTTCAYPSEPILAMPGKVTAECRWGYAPNAVLLADFCRIDDESFPGFGGGDAFRERDANDGKDEGPASLARSWAVQLEPWARWWWLGNWDVVFRNISQQIAWRDWTVLLTGEYRGLAAHEGTPAAASVER
jgi:hypothetical protein